MLLKFYCLNPDSDLVHFSSFWIPLPTKDPFLIVIVPNGLRSGFRGCLKYRLTALRQLSRDVSFMFIIMLQPFQSISILFPLTMYNSFHRWDIVNVHGGANVPGVSSGRGLLLPLSRKRSQKSINNGGRMGVMGGHLTDHQNTANNRSGSYLSSKSTKNMIKNLKDSKNC